MRNLKCLLLLIPVMLTARAAQAGSAEAKAKAARTACLSGDYAKGVALLAELFVSTHDHNYIYNQARCFEQNLRYQEAIGRFQEFLRVGPALSQDAKADAQKHIADCKELLASDHAAQSGAAATELPATSQAALSASSPPATADSGQPTVAAMTAPTVAAHAVLPPDVNASGQASVAAPQGSYLRVAGISCAVVGLASLATGVYFYTRATSLSDQITNSHTPSASDFQAGKDAQTMQWVFYGVGAATLATGSILYYLGWRAGHGDTAFAPMVAPGVAGLSAKGAF